MFLTLSGLAIAGLIALGVALTAGGVAITVGVVSDQQSKEEARQKLTDEIGRQTDQRNVLQDTIAELNGAIENIDAAKKQFLDGGHILNGKALAEDQIKECRSVVSETISYLNKAVEDINNNIKNLTAERDKI